MQAWEDFPCQGDPWVEYKSQILAHYSDKKPILTSLKRKGKQLFFFQASSATERIPVCGCLHVSCLPRKQQSFVQVSSLLARAVRLDEGDKAVLLLSLKTANLGGLTWCCSQVCILTASYLRARSSPPSCATWTALFTPPCLCCRIPQVPDTLQGFRPAEAQLGSVLSVSFPMQYLLRGRQHCLTAILHWF